MLRRDPLLAAAKPRLLTAPFQLFDRRCHARGLMRGSEATQIAPPRGNKGKAQGAVSDLVARSAYAMDR
jgi:hypothetical protein